MATHQQYETDVPMRVLDRGDKLFWNLTLGAMAQWAAFIGLAALVWVLIPDDAAGARISFATFVLAGGWFFIHRPIGGLVGGKWVLMVVRYRQERKLHHATPPARIVRVPRSRFEGAVDTRRWNEGGAAADGHGDPDDAHALLTARGDEQ